MANIVSCTYICEGAQEEIKQMFDILQKTAPKSNEYYWIGEVVNKLGMDVATCNCSGEILSFELKDGLLHIHQRTRWCEQKGLRQAIQKCFPSIKIYYSCMDYLGGVYYTNSFEHFPTKYILYASGEYMPFESIQELADYSSKLVGYHVEATKTSICEALNQYDQDEYAHYEVTMIDYVEQES